MHSWQLLLLLCLVPSLILLTLSFIGRLVHLLPYVFLSVFGIGGIAAILDGSTRNSLLGGLELTIGSFITLIIIINLFLIVSGHKHDSAILRSRRTLSPIKNIVLEKIEKPSFLNPQPKQNKLNKSGLQTHKRIKAVKSNSKAIQNLSNKHQQQF